MNGNTDDVYDYGIMRRIMMPEDCSVVIMIMMIVTDIEKGDKNNDNDEKGSKRRKS